MIDLFNPSPAVMEFFSILFLVLTIGCTIITGLFIAVYSRFPWRDRATGIGMMWLLRALFAVFFVIDMARLFGDYPGRILITTILYASVLIALVRLLYTLVVNYAIQPQSKQLSPSRFDDTIPGSRR